MPEDELDDPRLIRAARDMRRSQFLVDELDIAAIEIEAAAVEVACAPNRDSRDRARIALRARIHYHLSGAWDDGSGARADLLSALDVAQATTRELQRRVHELLKRVSDER